jgi:hypothetical protein
VADRAVPIGAIVVLVPDEHDGQDIARDQRSERKCTEKFVHGCAFLFDEQVQQLV